MKLLFDQNISYKLIHLLSGFFPNSNHVKLLNLEKADDKVIWQYAKENNFVIVTQDSDFYERSLIFGFPPKVIWLKCGNNSTKNIINVIQKNNVEILKFIENVEVGCLEIY